MKLLIAPLLAAVFGLATASGASASVTIGDSLANAGTPLDCGTGTPCTVMLEAVPGGGPVSAPSDGVIVRWRLRDSDGSSFVLRVVRTAASGQFTFVSSSAPGTGVSPGIAVFPTRQPVRAGDHIAVSWNGTDGLGVIQPGPGSTSVPGASFDYWESAPADGVTLAPDQPNSDTVEPLFNADMEPDTDHDGYGDETQDQCPTDASTQGPCPGASTPPPPSPPPPAPTMRDITPPSVKASIARLLRLSKKGTISFTLRSNEHATGSATGTISLPKTSKVVRFRSARLKLSANKRTKVTLKLSKRSLKKVRQALKHHRLKTKITVTLKDAAGNKTVKRRSVKLKR